MIVQQRVTVEEFLQLPEQKPYLELIHGFARQKAMPSAPHSYMQVQLGRRLANWSDLAGGFVLSEQRCILRIDGETQVVLPDLAWFPADTLPSLPAGAIHVPPALAVEILSPDDRYGEVQDKVSVYLQAGVMVVWVVDPLARKVTVYGPSSVLRVVSPPAVLSDPALSGLEIPLEDLFSRLPEQSQPAVEA